MAETIIRKQFTDKEVSEKYEYSGSWDANGKEKRIVFVGVYDGLLVDITAATAEKLLGVKYPGLKAKSKILKVPESPKA